MRILLKLDNGSEEVHEVSNVVIQLEEWSLELTPENDPLRFHLHVPSRVKEFCSFVVHHRCANTMTIEICPIRQPESEGRPVAE